MSTRPSDNPAVRIMQNYRLKDTNGMKQETKSNNNSFFKKPEQNDVSETEQPDIVSEVVRRIRNQRERIRNGRTDIT
jgi:ribosome-binding protein aMBF1 (putative translation factor)